MGERGDDEPESRESEPGWRIVAEESSSEPTPFAAPLRAMTPETAAQKMACSGSPPCPLPLLPSARSIPGPLLLLLLPPPLLLFMRMQRRLMHDCFLTPCPPNLDLSMQLMHSPAHGSHAHRRQGARAIREDGLLGLSSRIRFGCACSEAAVHAQGLSGGARTAVGGHTRMTNAAGGPALSFGVCGHRGPKFQGQSSWIPAWSLLCGGARAHKVATMSSTRGCVGTGGSAPPVVQAAAPRRHELALRAHLGRGAREMALDAACTR